jgi:hypothetical protein
VISLGRVLWPRLNRRSRAVIRAYSQLHSLAPDTTARSPPHLRMADSVRLAAKRFGRGTDLDAMPREYYQPGIAFETRRKDELQREQDERRREQLAAFADAVRRKEHWYFKALDGRDLTRKWAAEAQLDAGDDLDACIRCVVALCGCSTTSNRLPFAERSSRRRGASASSTTRSGWRRRARQSAWSTHQPSPPMCRSP